MNRRRFLQTGAAVLASSNYVAGAAELGAGNTLTFPRGFFWGTATSALQIEGACNEDGKGESIWNRFDHEVGRVKGAYTSDVACDSYHRYAQDIDCMRQMNQNSYRFSIAWTRIQPSGRGAPNSKGLDYYKRLADALLAANIRPNCTLYHFDLPQALQDQGGWPSRDTAARFADYAAIVVRELGDRIKVWAMLNEPLTFTQAGYLGGTMAPGIADASLALRASHTTNLAQGMGFRAMKAVDPKADIGGAFNIAAVMPATESLDDVALAERTLFSRNLWYIHPAMKGHYPTAAYPNGIPYEQMKFLPGDETIMHCPLDWIGVNYYRRSIVSTNGATASAQRVKTIATSSHGSTAKKGPLTDMGWEVWPEGIQWVLKRVAHEYDNPVIEVTENGCSYLDSPDSALRVADHRRIDFHRKHLYYVHRAIKEGVRVRGYHAWSLLDNFELAEGYTQRFGLVYVDFHDQRRILKDSAKWYGNVALLNALVSPT